MSIKVFLSTIYGILGRPAYLSLTIIIALLVVLVSIWLSIHEFIIWVLTNDVFSLAVKVKLLGSTWGVWQTNFTAVARIIMLIMASLTGLNVALLVFYLKKRIKMSRAAGTGLVGIIVGFLGVGCSACGSLILSSLFGLAGAAVVVKILPFNGYEIGFVSIVLLAVSIYLLVAHLQNPFICQINKRL